MRKERERKSPQSLEGSSLQVHRFPSLSASEQGHVTAGATSDALRAAPTSQPSSGVSRDAGGRISILPTWQHPSKHGPGFPQGMVCSRGELRAELRGRRDGTGCWSPAVMAKGTDSIQGRIKPHRPQMGVCKVESPCTALAPATPPGTYEAGGSAEGPSRAATAQTRPLKAFLGPRGAADRERRERVLGERALLFAGDPARSLPTGDIPSSAGPQGRVSLVD